MEQLDDHDILQYARRRPSFRSGHRTRRENLCDDFDAVISWGWLIFGLFVGLASAWVFHLAWNFTRHSWELWPRLMMSLLVSNSRFTDV